MLKGVHKKTKKKIEQEFGFGMAITKQLSASRVAWGVNEILLNEKNKIELEFGFWMAMVEQLV